MPARSATPYDDEFLAAADAVAAARPDADRDLAREVFLEAATLLHDGLALEGLDDHDTSAVVAGLCRDLGALDPGAAIRASARDAAASTDLHEPDHVSNAYLIAATLLTL